MKRGQLIKHLKKNGCCFHRQGSKHELWRNPNLERFTIAAVPRHTEITNVLAKKICKELEIPRL